MFKPMFGWWKMRNPERDWFLGGPRFELWNLKDKNAAVAVGFVGCVVLGLSAWLSVGWHACSAG